MVQKQKLIIFDLDGTLIDISRRWYRLHIDLSKKYKYKPYQENIYIRLKRNGVEEKLIMKDKLKYPSLPRYLKERKNLIESKRYLSLDRLKPKAKQILKSLDKNNYLFLTTSRKNRINLKNQLSQLNITNYFSKVVTANSLKARQNKLRHYIYSKKLECFMVGDTKIDYDIAKSLKIKCFLVCDGARSKGYLIKLKPHAIFDRISSLSPSTFDSIP